MSWRIDFSPASLKFLSRNNLTEDLILEKIGLALRRLQGEDAHVDIKKLKGEWRGNIYK